MSSEAQTVLVIEDASKVSPSINCVLQSLALQPGDTLILLGIIHHVTIPLGGWMKVGQVNPVIVTEEVAKRQSEYNGHQEVKKALEQCKTEKVAFKVYVQAGASLKIAVLQAARNFDATWLIIDRKMKKDEEFLKESLSCGILRIKRKNKIIELRKPKRVDRPRHPRNQNNDRIRGCNSTVFGSTICSICNIKRPSIGWKSDFTYVELQTATDKFSSQNCIASGFVYKGKLNGLKIAVEKIKCESFLDEEEFKYVIYSLCKARQENLVMLLGLCLEGNRWFLMWEYICNGNLDQHLSSHPRIFLDWNKRMKIALETASGLKYLHDNKIIHGNLSPSNILLTHDYKALLGFYGFQRDNESDVSSGTAIGNLAYLAPEYAENGKLTTRTDCYSFGVVLLQLITGLRTTDPILGGRSLTGWAKPLLKERNYPGLIDRTVVNSNNTHQLFWMVRLAEKCLSRDPRRRLSMEQMVYALSNIMAGNRVPVTRYFSPARSDSFSSISLGTASLGSMHDVTIRLPPSITARAITSR